MLIAVFKKTIESIKMHEFTRVLEFKKYFQIFQRLISGYGDIRVEDIRISEGCDIPNIAQTLLYSMAECRA
jgi:hypothetical protein